MNTTNKNREKDLFHVSVDGIGIKVFRVGASPRIPTKEAVMKDPEIMRGIHTHFTYEVFFVTSGTLTLITEDYSKDYESSVFIISPKIKHYSVPSDNGSYCLLFSFDSADKACEKRIAAIKEKLSEGVYEMPMTEEIAFYIKTLAEKSAMRTAEAERSASLLAELIFNSIIYAILPRGSLSSAKGNVHYEHIEAIETYINNHLHKKITLSDIAKCVYLSTKQISRIIEREYGCGFSELIADKRLASAEILVKNTDLSISKIAERTFYGTEAYFYTAFKKKYGMTPLQYRREAKLFKL